jgi:hypothetical protein
MIMKAEWRSERPDSLSMRAIELLSHYRYKPTVHLTVVPSSALSSFAERPLLRIEMAVPDARRQGVRGSGWRAARFVTDYESHNFRDYEYEHARSSSDNRLNPDGRPVADVHGVQEIPMMVLEPGAEDEFERWLFGILVDLEVHEAREWFCKDDAIVDDPHHPNGRLPA